MDRRRWWPPWRPRLHRGIILRVEHHGELLLSLDSDTLHAVAELDPHGGWQLFRIAAGRDWPDIIIKPVMLPD